MHRANCSADSAEAACRWSRLMGSREHREAPQALQGLYMWGGVGVGKTMLMDLFAQAAPGQFKVSLCLVLQHVRKALLHISATTLAGHDDETPNHQLLFNPSISEGLSSYGC